jgi:hypothetical protein
MSDGPVLSIRYEQSLDLAGADGWNPGRRVFVQLFDSMISSGLPARLSGNAFKVLSALGLAASPLGSGSARDEAFFRDLITAGVLAPDDRGKLFCYVAHDELVRRTGVSKNTLSRCTAELEEHGMIAKRVIRKRDGTRYNVYFILPGSHLDKYNTHHPPAQRADSKPVPETGTGSETMPLPDGGTVPEVGMNLRPIVATTTTTTAPAQADFDQEAVLAYFAQRKGLAHYRPTAHDRKRLALLQEEGYSATEVRAAIDRAFDTLPPDAPPIRMFSYCATIALATPPRRLPTPESTRDSAVEPPGDPASPDDAANANTDTPPVLKHAIRLYESEIGPVTPLIEAELYALVAEYPDASEWDAAFREAVRADVHKLRYVHKVLAGRAARAASNLPLPGGTHVKYESAATQRNRG